MVGDLTRPASYKTILGRVCLEGHATGAAIDGVNSLFYELCAIAFKTNPVKTLSSETLVWLLLAVAYSDLLTTSQAEVPLEDTCILLGNGSVQRPKAHATNFWPKTAVLKLHFLLKNCSFW